MSAVDLASSHLSGDMTEGDWYEAAASTLGSRYKRITRSKVTLPTNGESSSDFKVVKLEVKAHSRPAGRSGLLATQLKGYDPLARTILAQLIPGHLLTTLSGPFAGLLHSRVYR